jgi:hypothetical protein
VEEITAAACVHDPSNSCRRPATALFISLVGDYGTGPSVEFTGACSRHQRAVRSQIENHLRELSWFGLGEIQLSDVAAMLAWFHERSGLCATHRLSVSLPA